MNPFRRFFDFIGNPSHSRTLSILFILTIALAVPLTVQIAQKQQEIRQHAAGNCTGVCIYQGTCPQGWTTNGDFCSGTGGTCCAQSSSSQPSQVTNPTSTPSNSGTGGSSQCPTGCTYQTARCSGRGEDRECTDAGCYNTGTSTPCTVTITATPPPATPTPTPSIATSCPLGGFPTIQGGSPWGGDCSSVGEGTFRTFNVTSNTCYTAQCERLYSNPQNPLCWYNSGVSGPPAACPTTSPSSALCTVPGDIGTCTQTDQAKGRIINGSCQRVCPIGTAKAGQTVSGVSYKECQSNLCWYDSYYDKTPAKIAEGQTSSNGPGWCFPDPNTTDPCVSSTASAPPSSTPTSSSVVTFSVSFAGGIQLDGIGNFGDTKNHGNAKPSNPIHQQRTFVVGLYNNAGDASPAYTGTGALNYAGGIFTGPAINIQAPPGSYFVKIQSRTYLRQLIKDGSGNPLKIAFTAGMTYQQVNQMNLATGDLNGDNQVGSDDYPAFSTCYNQSPTGACVNADLDDNGVIDLADFNLFLREFGLHGD